MDMYQLQSIDPPTGTRPEIWDNVLRMHSLPSPLRFWARRKSPPGSYHEKRKGQGHRDRGGGFGIDNTDALMREPNRND